jgi:Predicted membrane protein (DUF2306)
MSLSRFQTGPNAIRAKAAVRWIFLAAFGTFVIRAAVTALNAAVVQDDFPEALAVKVELMPVVFPLHMLTGGLALVLVPLAIALRNQAHWHRLAGRIAALDIVLAGLTAVPVALVAPVTPWSAAGFTAQGLTWLALLGWGVRNIRLRRVARHRAAMLMLAATTSGAIFFRIYLALWAIFAQRQHFELFYACDAWIAWTLPLAITAFWLKRGGTWLSHSG